MIPNGYKNADWSEATHALSNGAMFPIENDGNYMRIDFGDRKSGYWPVDTASRLNLIPLVKVPDEVTVYVPFDTGWHWTYSVQHSLSADVIDRMQSEPFTFAIKFGEKE